MYAVPSKDALMQDTGISSEAHVNAIVETTDRIKSELWRFFKERGID